MRGYSVRLAGLIHALDYAEIKGQRAALSAISIGKLWGGDAGLWCWRITSLTSSTCGSGWRQQDLLVGSEDCGAGGEPRGPQGDGNGSGKRKVGKDSSDRRKMLQSLVSEYGLGKIVQAPRMNQTWWQLT